MTSLALRSIDLAVPALSEMIERQRTLAFFGMIMALLALIAFALQGIDPRLLGSGVNVWVKPAKFFSSIALFSLTAAWFFGYVRPERRTSRPMRFVVVTILVAGSLELGWIAWQAANGLESHFNTGTIFHAVMYALMGLFALLLTGTVLPLAWEIGRRPAQELSRDFVAAVVMGLLLTFLLGAGLGGYMSAQPGHSVGVEGGHVPLFGWNRSGGDLRIAHFLGIHSEQAIPILAALVAGAAPRIRWAALIGGTALYVALTLAIFGQAVAGRPLFPA